MYKMPFAPDPLDTEHENSLRLYQALSKSYKTIAEICSLSTKLHGLNPTEFAVLQLLFSEGQQPLQKIGSTLLLQSGGVTYVIDKMEKNGWIRREPCPRDRRVTYAALTEEGTRLMGRIVPAHAAVIQEAVNGLTPEEKQLAAALLNKLGQAAEKKKSRLTRELSASEPTARGR